MRRLTALVCSVVLLVACSGDDDDSAEPDAVTTTTTEPEAEAEPAIEVTAGTLSDRECDYEPAIEIEHDCQFLEVPENWTAPDGPTVRLAVTVLHSPSADPLSDPVIYLHGGPGGDTVQRARHWLDDPFLEQRDVVLYDQRGSGLSEPSLDCPEVNEAIIDTFRSIEPFEDTLEKRRTAITECRDRLVDDGLDLNAYDSEASAADLESLRLALDVEQWNLLGVSYGTRLALTYMRSFPDAIRSALLDSVYPTDVGKAQGIIDSADRALTQLVDGCGADPACAARFPDFATALDRAFAQLNAEPFAGDVDLGEENGGVIALEIDGYDALAGLFTALYDEALIPLLPDIVEDVAAGDYAIIPAIAQQGIPFATQFADGAALSIDCADNAGVESAIEPLLENPGRYQTLIVESGNTYCDLWDVEPTSPTYNEPVTVDLPALVFAGRYDPVTPPADSRSAADAIPNATFVEVDGIGHGVLYADPCGMEMYLAFLAEPTAPVDTACGEEHPGPVFVTT
ncbi:MAG: alpha/beta hydrolase [Actinomycetota bacterium]